MAWRIGLIVFWDNSMSLSRQMTFWIVAIVVVVGGLWLLREILLPFVAGMALAYLLDPLANRIERLGISRLAAALLIVVTFTLALLVLAVLVVPILGGQLSALIDRLPDYAGRLQALMADRPGLRKVLGELPNADIGDVMKEGAGWLATFLHSLWSGGQALISLFSLLVVTPVVAFYLIYDWENMVKAVDDWVPRPQLTLVRQLALEIDEAMAGFVRGQTGVCLILGSFYAVALTLVQLNFGLLIGLIAGLITFIPYVGSLTGLVLGLGIAVAQFWPDYSAILEVLGIFLIGQFVEAYVLSPKLVGESIGLHPVWLIFALFAFGYLFGTVGFLVAVPLAAAIGVITRFALHQYLNSPLYTGVAQPSGTVASISACSHREST